MHNGVFSKSFKISPVIPVYKTDETYEKNNYRPHDYTFESVQNLWEIHIWGQKKYTYVFGVAC